MNIFFVVKKLQYMWKKLQYMWKKLQYCQNRLERTFPKSYSTVIDIIDNVSSNNRYRYGTDTDKIWGNK